MRFIGKGGLALAAALLLCGLAAPANAAEFTVEVFGPVPVPAGPATMGYTDWVFNVDHPLVSSTAGITGLDVFVDIEHGNAAGELKIKLLAPDGRIVRLYKFLDSPNATGTHIAAEFDDDAAISVNDVVGPVIGSFRPVDPMAWFHGAVFEGDWTLRVEDWAFGPEGVGQINSVRLEAVVNPEPGSMALLGAGLIGMAGYVRRRRKRKQQQA